MNYEILIAVLKSTRKSGCDGEKKTLNVELGMTLSELEKRLSSSTTISPRISPTRMQECLVGGGRGWRGGSGGGFGGASNSPMGLSFADLQNLSREVSALYPVC